MTDRPEVSRKVYAYLSAIRNDRKRQYGFAYLAWTRNPVGDPPRPLMIGTMAAQAVRMTLAELEGEASNA